MPYIPGLPSAGASEETELFPIEQTAGTRKLALSALRLRSLTLAPLPAGGALTNADTVLINQGGAPVVIPLSALTGFSNVGALQIEANLSDLASVSTARNNLGLGSAALNDTGDFDAAGDAAAAQAAAQASSLQKSANLSDVASPSAAVSNLGLGSPSAEGSSRALVNSDNGKTLVASASPVFTIDIGLTAGFGCAIKGDFTFVGTATVTDVRESGSSNPWCALVQTGTDTYDIVGAKV